MVNRFTEGTIRSGNRPNRPFHRRRWALAPAAIGLMLVLAGCGASSSATPNKHVANSPKLVLDAYTQTISGKTAMMTLSETVSQSTATSLPQQVTITGHGMVDFTTGDGGLTFNSSATGSYADRFISPVLYLELPAKDSTQLPPGKTWVSVNLNTVSEAKLGQSLAQLADSSQETTQTLSYLQGVSSSGITTVGPATIKGTATTEYKATVDLTKVADRKSPTAAAALKALEAQLHTTMLPLQVWLDSQGRVRQVSTQLSESTNAQSNSGSTTPASSGSISTTVDYYDFGTPVSVTPPPAAQVDDITTQALAAANSTTTTGG